MLTKKLILLQNQTNMKKLILLFVLLISVNFAFSQVDENLSEKEKARRQKNIDIGNPFARFGYKPKIATLSKGKYLEFHDRDTIVKIGSYTFHTRKKVITGFINLDTVRSEATLRPELISRWFNPDPLSDEFPRWSPYTFVADNPIRFIDPYGRYFIVKGEEEQKNIIQALATAFNGNANAFSFNKDGKLSINQDKLGDLSDDQQFLFDSFNTDVVTNEKNDLVVQSTDGNTMVNYAENDKGGVTGTISLNINQSDFNDKMRDTSDGTVNGDGNYEATDSEKRATAIYHEVGHFREDVTFGNKRDNKKGQKAVGYENIYRKIRGFNARQGKLHGLKKKNGKYSKKHQGQSKPTGYNTD